jgi:hypothetical protein
MRVMMLHSVHTYIILYLIRYASGLYATVKANWRVGYRQKKVDNSLTEVYYCRSLIIKI